MSENGGLALFNPPDTVTQVTVDFHVIKTSFCDYISIELCILRYSLYSRISYQTIKVKNDIKPFCFFEGGWVAEKGAWSGGGVK